MSNEAKGCIFILFGILGLLAIVLIIFGEPAFYGALSIIFTLVFACMFSHGASLVAEEFLKDDKNEPK